MYTEEDLQAAYKKGIETGVKCGKKGSTWFLLASIGIILLIRYVIYPLVIFIVHIPSEYFYKTTRDIFTWLCVVGAFFWINLRNFLVEKALEKEGVNNGYRKED